MGRPERDIILVCIKLWVDPPSTRATTGLPQTKPANRSIYSVTWPSKACREIVGGTSGVGEGGSISIGTSSLITSSEPNDGRLMQLESKRHNNRAGLHRCPGVKHLSQL